MYRYISPGFLVGSVVKNLPPSAGNMGSVPGLRRSPPEEEIAIHSSILAWVIPWIGEPGGLQSTGSQRVRCYLVTKQQINISPTG